MDYELALSPLCVGLAVALTMCFVGAFHIPHPYMALVFATTLSMLPRPKWRQVFHQLVALTLGCISSVLLLTAFPQEPWFFIPLLGVIATTGYAIFLKRSGPGSAAAFSFFFLAIHISCIAENFSINITTVAVEFWLQCLIPIIVSYGATSLLKKENHNLSTQTLSFSSLVVIGLAASIAGLVDASIEADQAGRLLISSFSTAVALELASSAQQLLPKLCGYILGMFISFAFIIIVASSGNNFGFYLLSLGLTFACLEWLSCRYNRHTVFYQSSMMMLSFCALMLPAPDPNLKIPSERCLATLIGFLIAMLIFLLGRELRKFNKNENQ